MASILFRCPSRRTFARTRDHFLQRGGAALGPPSCSVPMIESTESTGRMKAAFAILSRAERDQSGNQQDVNQGVQELAQENAHDAGGALAGELVRAEAGAAVFRFIRGKPLLGSVQLRQRLFGGQRVPRRLGQLRAVEFETCHSAGPATMPADGDVAANRIAQGGKGRVRQAIPPGH
ncbi:MAG: hypothetical protein U5K56_13810 [Halioglobus sp.]|nr:hypothetical protein [Halioglobus sp.]